MDRQGGEPMAPGKMDSQRASFSTGKGGAKMRAFKEYSPTRVIGAAAGSGIGAPYNHLIPGAPTSGAADDPGLLKAASQPQHTSFHADQSKIHPGKSLSNSKY